MKRLFIEFEDVLYERRFSRLHISVLKLSTEDFGQLLDKSTLSEINALDFNSRSPLYWAVRRADPWSSKSLLLHGADPNAGTSAVAWSCSESFVSPETLRNLLDYGADPNGRDLDGHTALQACGLFGKDDTFIHPLLAAGADIDAIYRGELIPFDGMTALGFACLHRHPRSAQILLKSGANVDCKDVHGRTPLHLVLSHSRSSKDDAAVQVSDLLNTLLEYGVSSEIRDDRGFNPANLAMLNQDTRSLESLMNIGTNIVYPPERGSPDNGYCMLAWPMENSWASIFTFLLERKELDFRDTDPRTGASILHLVARYASHRMLVAFEEKVNLALFDGHAIDHSGQTPIDCFVARTKKDQGTTDAFNGLIRRIDDLKHQGEAPVEGFGQSETFFDAEQVPAYLDGKSSPQMKSEETLASVMLSGYNELKSIDSTFGQNIYRVKQYTNQRHGARKNPSISQDSELELTLRAWRGRLKARRVRRVNHGYDSGYASAESSYESSDEEEIDEWPEESPKPEIFTDKQHDIKDSKECTRRPFDDIKRRKTQAPYQPFRKFAVSALMNVCRLLDMLPTYLSLLVLKTVNFLYYQAAPWFTRCKIEVGEAALTLSRNLRYLSGLSISAPAPAIILMSLIPLFLFSPAFKKSCFRRCRPRTHQGYTRITWICVSKIWVY